MIGLLVWISPGDDGRPPAVLGPLLDRHVTLIEAPDVGHTVPPEE